MTTRRLHIVHLLIRREHEGKVEFLIYPHDKWKDEEDRPYLTLPTKKTVTNPLAPFLQGTSIDAFVDGIATKDLGLGREDYAIELEIEPAQTAMDSPTTGEPTEYTIYPIDLWVKKELRDNLCGQLNGKWVTCEEGEKLPEISPTAKKVFEHIRKREAKIHGLLKNAPPKPPAAAAAPVPGPLLLDCASGEASMDALALRWLAQNRAGVRCLEKKTIDEVLDAGNRAFNLRVADPYLRYQMQGVGFTWSFFTEKDKQDCHVHGAPVVEIYGVLEGRMEIWWKPYYERGTSAWSHRILKAGDWAEVDSLQCHIVQWLGQGKGVVFKAGPGPLAEVGKLGVKGKTPCADCPCMKPVEVHALERPKKPN
jgi:hypothetical protein